MIENDRLQGFSATLDGHLPLITPWYNPDRAHVKLGPLYFDILSLGTGLLYTDFQPGENYPDSLEADDGWIGFVEFDLRALLRISNTFYLSAATRLMYLPASNRVAWQLGYGTQPFAQFRLNYENTWGPWDFLAYNDFGGFLGVDLWNELGSGAVDRAGRYYFGIPDLRNRNYRFFDRDAAMFINALGASASRALGQYQNWRLWLNAEHRGEGSAS